MQYVDPSKRDYKGNRLTSTLHLILISLPALKLNLIQQLKGQFLFILVCKMLLFRRSQVEIAQVQVNKA